MTKQALAEQSVGSMLERMAVNSPDPGAGSAAAVAVALAAALLEKAVRLSRDHMADADTAITKADDARTQALRLADEDAEAVNVLVASGDPSEAKAEAPDPIDVPRQIADLAREVGDLADRLGQHVQPLLRADAVAARVLAEAAASTAAAVLRSNEG